MNHFLNGFGDELIKLGSPGARALALKAAGADITMAKSRPIKPKRNPLFDRPPYMRSVAEKKKEKGPLITFGEGTVTKMPSDEPTITFGKGTVTRMPSDKQLQDQKKRIKAQAKPIRVAKL